MLEKDVLSKGEELASRIERLREDMQKHGSRYEKDLEWLMSGLEEMEGKLLRYESRERWRGILWRIVVYGGMILTVAEGIGMLVGW